MKKKSSSTKAKAKRPMKTCSRGHHFRGPGVCPVCWPGGRK